MNYYGLKVYFKYYNIFFLDNSTRVRQKNDERKATVKHFTSLAQLKKNVEGNCRVVVEDKVKILLLKS